MERNMINTICYRTIDNKEYLFCVRYEPFENVEKIVDFLNTEKPIEYMDREINWNQVKEFFADEQEDLF